MKTLRAQTSIEAAPASVWAALTDFDAFPSWNPFIVAIRGEPTVGSRLEVRIQPPGRRAMTFRPVVITATPNEELAWLGRIVVPGLFDGEHHLRIAPSENGSVFIQEEFFTGLLVPLFGSGLEATRRGFEAMNAALERRLEQRPSG
jgi:hypothetical protein